MMGWKHFVCLSTLVLEQQTLIASASREQVSLVVQVPRRVEVVL
jgi:hypothetical protein